MEPLGLEREVERGDAQVTPLERERHPGLGGATGDDRLRLRMLPRREGHATADDRGFLGCDQRQRVAQLVLVVVVDGPEDDHPRLAHRGGVEPAPEAHLQDRDVHPLAAEVVERERGARLEDGQVEPGDELSLIHI